jgi:predicted hydrocarbon binding protein
MAGEKVTRMILQQIGQQFGGIAYTHSKEHKALNDPIEALDHVLRNRRLGRALHLDKVESGSKVTYICKFSGHQACQGAQLLSPTCHVTRGVVSQWLESLHHRTAEHVETACAGGSQPCIVRVTFRK